MNSSFCFMSWSLQSLLCTAVELRTFPVLDQYRDAL